VPEKIITVFGSSRPQQDDADYLEARALGEQLAKAGFAVCSGAYGGVMEAVSRGAKSVGGKTYGVTSEFFSAAKANAWIDVEMRMKTWDERLFELIKMGNGFVVCKGGTGTLAEFAVLWEMQNKAVVERRPIVALGDFWTPILSRVREVEVAANKNVATPWAESAGPLIKIAGTAKAAADYLEESLGKS
jgi:uncharacterized protein (TIGR00725 family)